MTGDSEPQADADRRESGEEYPPTPFSFKLMIVLGGLYLGWRLVQGIVALVRWIA